MPAWAALLAGFETGRRGGVDSARSNEHNDRQSDSIATGWPMAIRFLMGVIFMNSIVSKIRLYGPAVAFSVWAAMISSAGYAYTPEQQQLCTGDAMRLCSSEIPDVARVTVCMIAKKAQLSPGCRSVFRDEQESVQTERPARMRAAKSTGKERRPPRKSRKPAAKSNR